MTTVRNWSAATSPQDAARRAAGRRHLNFQRQQAAIERRHRVWVVLFKEGRMYEKGVKQRLATMLGVSYRQIVRDIKALLAEMRPCPTCGSPSRLRHKV
jgi:hypothetical protein